MAANDNFAPPKSYVADVSLEGSTELASRGARLGAYIVDVLTFLIPVLPIYTKFIAAAVKNPAFAQDPAALVRIFQDSALWTALGGLIELAVLIVDIIFIYRYSQTIGKRVLKIKVVRTDGSAASFSRIFWLRGFVNGLISGILSRFVPFVGSFYWLIDVCFIFGGPRRCVHDYIADTIVVKA